MKSFETQFRSLGTDISCEVILENEEIFEKIEKEIGERYQQFEKIFSRFDSNSELSVLNDNLGKWNETSCEMVILAQKALEFYRKSEAVFDPRVLSILERIGYDRDFHKIGETEASSKLISNARIFNQPLENDLEIKEKKIFFGHKMDFSGIAKGYITDRISDFLLEQGIKNFFLDSGGDAYAAGKNLTGEAWAVSVEGFPEDKVKIGLSNEAIATSGISRRKWEIQGKRYHHLVNPKNPYQFNFDLKSVSVIRKNVLEADFWAKYLFLLGETDGTKKAQEEKLGSIFLDYRGDAIISPEIKKYLIKSV